MLSYVFSDKMAALQPSAIREILKATSVPGMIPFAAGNPSAEAFPVSEIQRITANILQEQPFAALQYGITEGYAPLIERIRSMASERADAVREEDGILVTAGAQQAIELFAKCTANEGDVVLAENPSFIGSLNSFRSLGATLRGVEMEADGLSIEKLEAALRQNPKPKFLYTIPNFQNPTGSTMSLQKRLALLELAEKYDILVLEDNPYGELRFDGEDVPALKSLDKYGRVMYVGSFSKVLAPGLRLGYAIGPKPLIAKMTVAKQGEDVHTALLPQMIAERFLAENDFAAHVERLRTLYRAKAHLMLDGMAAKFPSEISWVSPEGGLFVWCRLPDSTDMLDYVKRAVEKQVAVVPGTAFLTDQSEVSHSIRLNFSTPTDEQIERGIEILGGLAL